MGSTVGPYLVVAYSVHVAVVVVSTCKFAIPTCLHMCTMFGDVTECCRCLVDPILLRVECLQAHSCSLLRIFLVVTAIHYC